MKFGKHRGHGGHGRHGMHHSKMWAPFLSFDGHHKGHHHFGKHHPLDTLRHHGRHGPKRDHHHKHGLPWARNFGTNFVDFILHEEEHTRERNPATTENNQQTSTTPGESVPHGEPTAQEPGPSTSCNKGKSGEAACKTCRFERKKWAGPKSHRFSKRYLRETGNGTICVDIDFNVRFMDNQPATAQSQAAPAEAAVDIDIEEVPNK